MSAGTGSTTKPAAQPTAPAKEPDRYDAAGPEVRQSLTTNMKAMRELRKSDDPAKNFFEFTTRAQERADLLKQVQDKSTPGADKDAVTREQQDWAGLAGSNFYSYKNSPALQAQLKQLTPEQQKSFQAGLERFEADEAKRAAQPLDPAQQRKADLQKTVSAAPLKLLDLSSEANKDPSKALEYSKVWNEADAARRELGDAGSPAWYGAHRDVLNTALSRPGISDDLRGKLEGERDRVDAAEAKDKIKELDQEIADIKSGKKPVGDVALRERLKGMYQDRIDRVEGKGPPTAAYQVEKKQLEEQRADLDKRIAELKAKSAPPQGQGQGTGGTGTGNGNGAAAPAATGPDEVTAARLKRLENEKATLGQKIEKLDADHRDKLNDYAKQQAEKAAKEPQKALDGLLDKRAGLDRQLKDPNLDPAKRPDLEKQRAALDGDVAKAKDEVKKAEQQALDKVRTDAKKGSGAEQLWKEGEDFKRQLGEYEERAGLPEKRVAVDKAKENLGFTERRLEQVKKERDDVANNKVRVQRDGQYVPKAELMKELDERVDLLEKGLAGDRAKLARAEANLAGAEVGAKELEAQRRLKYAQATAAEVGADRLGERLGQSGLPLDLETDLKSPDEKVRSAAADKAASWMLNNPRVSGDAKAELRDMGRRLGFEPHDDRQLYHMAKNADAADKDFQKAKADAVRTAAEADKLEAEAKAKGVQVPPPPTPFTPEPKYFDGKVPPKQPAAQPPADPQPAQGKPAPQKAPEPEKQRAPINPALSPEDQAHLKRQGKEILEMGENIKNKLQPVAEFLAGLPANPANPTTPKPSGPGAPDVDIKVPDPLKDVGHDVLKAILENPAATKMLMEKERQAYGFFMQAADTVGGLYQLGEMGVKGLADIAKDPKGAAEKFWNNMKYAVENPDKVAKDAWDGAVKIGKGVKDAVVKSYEKDPEEFKGRAAFEVLSALLPGVGQAKHAGKAGKVAEIANAADKVADAAKVADKAADAAKVADKAADAAKVADKAADAAKVADKSQDVLRPGTQAFDDLKKTVEAKEELARRLRDSLPGGKHEPPPGAKGKSMSGAGEMKPEQIQQQIAKLEKEAAEGRAALDKATKAGRLPVDEIGAQAEKAAAKYTPEEFSDKVMGYPKELKDKFTNGEIESTRVYLGNEVRGDPLQVPGKPPPRFAQSDLQDILDELAVGGAKDAKGNVIPPGEFGRINYKHINGYLREAKKDLTPGQIDRVKMVQEKMDDMMAKSTVTEPTTVYRVNSKKHTVPGKDGTIAPDPGYMSTGRTPQLGFAGDAEKAKESVLQIIELPKGQQAIDMDALTRYYGDLDSFRGRMPAGVKGQNPFGENELLLPRGTTLKVVDQWVDPKTGLTVQRCQVVPSTPPLPPHKRPPATPPPTGK